MADTSGVCVIVPHGQMGFRPQVFGMGIVAARRTIVTCAHVVNAALGVRWWNEQSPGRITVSFPFAAGTCLDGVVSRDLWIPPGRGASNGLTDFAVIRLPGDVPVGVGMARLAPARAGLEIKAYGFRGEYREDKWSSHPDGQWANGVVAGPQPGGRAQFDGLRATGARVEKGFSGSGVYSPADDAIVGMIVESDKDPDSRVAQFIDASQIIPVIRSTGVYGLPIGILAIPEDSFEQEAIAEARSVGTGSEILSFVGRKPEQEKFMAMLSESKGYMHFVGHGGIGKSSLLKKLASLASAEGVSTAYVDLGFVQSPLDLARKIVASLIGSGSCRFTKYLECVRRYAAIEESLLGRPDLKRGIIYYISKLREIVPHAESSTNPDDFLPESDTSEFSSGDSFAVYEALSVEDRDFFVDPSRRILDAFAQDLGSDLLVFQLDRTERVHRRVGEWVIRSFLPRLGHVVTVSAGRDDISRVWGSQVGAGRVRVVELGPLSDGESESLLRNVGVPEGQLRRRVVTTSRGVPLALVLGAEVADNVEYQQFASSVDSYVVDNMIHVFLDGIPDARKQALQRLSIFRRFIRETVLELTICDSSTIDEMLEVRFVKHVPNGYAIHDRVRDFILRDLRRHQPRAYRLLHEEAATHYQARMGPYTDGNPDFLEWLYHELCAHPQMAFEQLRKEFSVAALAIKPDFCEALIGVAHESNVDLSLPSLWLRYFEGTIRRQRFDFRGASEIYEEILRDPEIEHLDDLRAELLYQRSVALWYLCRFTEARAAAQESVTLNHSMGKVSLETRSLGIVGLSLDRMGLFTPAIRTVEKMARQALAGNDPVSRGYALNSVGYFSWHAGEWRRTERALQESLDVWRSIKNPVGECYPLGHLGLLYCSTGRYEMAKDVLSRGEGISRLSGNLEMLAKILQNLSHYHRRMGHPEQAVEIGQESLDVCDSIDHPYFAADSLRLLSEAYLDLGNFVAARQAVLAGLDRLPGQLAAYLYLRLKVAKELVETERIIMDGPDRGDQAWENLSALARSAEAAGYTNLAAESQFGLLKLAVRYRPDRISGAFEVGASYAFSYNWYAGMYYLERSKIILTSREHAHQVWEDAAATFGKERLLQLYRAADSQALKCAVDTDSQRVAEFAERE